MALTETAASYAARAFFYPSLAWNIARARLQDTWHWWDEITEGVILGAIPFYSDLEELKKLGVTAVVTLNEEFEVFITTDQYKERGLQHLHIPTVDFLFAPPIADLHRGADFIHENAQPGKKVYVHCKAGRGRSTTLVLCYLIKYSDHTPEQAYTFVRQRRPQVYLAQGQWSSVCAFYVSCHPDKDLDPTVDFPYPKFMPEADDESLCTSQKESTPAESAVGAAESESTSCTQEGDNEQCLDKTEDLPPSCPPCLDSSETAEKPTGDAQPKENGCSSFLSVKGIVEALEACPVQAYPESGGEKHIAADVGGGEKHISADGDGTGNLEGQSASQAITIPPKKTDESDKFKSTASSLAMEPSGSLPGYVKIVPYKRLARRYSKSASPPSVCTASLAAAVQDDHCLPGIKSGFADACNDDDDWASISSDF